MRLLRLLRLPSCLQTLASKFDETMQLAGNVVVQMATNTAAAVKAAQGALDDAVPGPSVQRVLINLRCAPRLQVVLCACS